MHDFEIFNNSRTFVPDQTACMQDIYPVTLASRTTRVPVIKKPSVADELATRRLQRPHDRKRFDVSKRRGGSPLRAHDRTSRCTLWRAERIRGGVHQAVDGTTFEARRCDETLPSGPRGKARTQRGAAASRQRGAAQARKTQLINNMLVNLNMFHVHVL